MKIKITLENSGGELDVRIVESRDGEPDVEEKAQRAALDIIAGVANLCPGDVIRIVEIED